MLNIELRCVKIFIAVELVDSIQQTVGIVEYVKPRTRFVHKVKFKAAAAVEIGMALHQRKFTIAPQSAEIVQDILSPICYDHEFL